jgi:hypothetical protein
MKTKAEILSSQCSANGQPITNYIGQDGYVWKLILRAMQEYADQETTKVILKQSETIIRLDKWFVDEQARADSLRMDLEKIKLENERLNTVEKQVAYLLIFAETNGDICNGFKTRDTVKNIEQLLLPKQD